MWSEPIGIHLGTYCLRMEIASNFQPPVAFYTKILRSTGEVGFICLITRNIKEKATNHLKNNERFNTYILEDIKNSNRVQRLTEIRSPLSMRLWENHDRSFGYHYFTPKD